MLRRIRKALLRISLSVSWRKGPRRMAPMLRRFAMIEADSSWQFLRAAEQLSSSDARAQMFLHAMDEAHQASRFYEVAKAVDPTSLRLGEAKRQALLTDPADLGAFLAVVEVADVEKKNDYGVYAEASVDPGATALFESLQQEEAAHAAGTRALMQSTLGSGAAVTESLAQAWRQRLWDGWLRVGADTSNVIASVLISLVFFLAGPFFAWRARSRVAPRPLRSPHALPES